MKAGILLSVLIFLTALVGYVVLSSPRTFYDTAILHGMDNDLLVIKKTNETIRKGKSTELQVPDGLIVSEDNVWKKLHFKDFVIPLPMHHPLFLTLPHITQIDDDFPMIGFKLLDQKEKEMNTFLFEHEFSLMKHFDDKVFNLPFFKNRLGRISTKKIWEDLFVKEIGPSNGREEYSISYLFNNPDKVIFGILYDIYILKMRTEIFNINEIRDIKFYKGQSLGVLSIIDDETKRGRPQQYSQEVLYFLNKDKVHRIHLRTKLGVIASKGYRKKLIKELEYLKSENEKAIMIYSEYNILPYFKKIDQEGMIYLYAAWSHDMEKKSFFAEMIDFMERGKSNYVQVNSLYEFALKKFGSNFSSDMEKLKETQNQKLQRKISEEREREIINIKKQENYVPDTFESKEHKINFFLNRAKDSGVNIDDNNSELIGD